MRTSNFLPWQIAYSEFLFVSKNWPDFNEEDLDNAISKTPSTEIGLTSPLGYQTPAEFYAPAYATEKARRSMVPDYRTTLYWNPTVKLDDTGQATVEFYTSDAPADYDITIEGITQTGKIVQRRQRLRPE